MSDILLNVEIPANIAEGTPITVAYEDRFFEIVVPPGGPGTTIQVSIPAASASLPVAHPVTAIDPNVSPAAADVSTTAPSAVNPASQATSSSTPESAFTNTKNVAIAGAAGVVVGALILGPLTVGAVVLTGAAAYAAKHHVQHLPEEVGPDGVARKKDDGTTFSKVAVVGTQAVKSVQSIDEKYKVTATIAATAVTVGQQIKETDQKYQITEKAAEAAKTAAAKIQETDEKYQISAKAAEATNAALAKARQLNEEHKVTERAAAATSAFAKMAMGAMAKLSAPSSATAAATPVPAPGSSAAAASTTTTRK